MDESRALTAAVSEPVEDLRSTKQQMNYSQVSALYMSKLMRRTDL